MHANTRQGPDRVSRLLGLMSAIPLGLIVVLTFVDVFARYLISAPIRGSVEIIQYAMALTIFAALPLVTRDREHVTVSLIDGLLGSRALGLKRWLCDGVSFLVLLTLTWRLWIYAGEAIEGERRTIVLALPEGPLVYVMSVFSLVTAAVVLIHLIHGLKGSKAS
jgi:TRAP-type C4-dicarboxylate transport system permease small subunit